MKKYITTPIYYPSGKLHLGHVYSTVSADVLKRLYLQNGDEVIFLTGTDEHGEKIEKKAQEENKTPQVYVDEKVKEIKELWKILDVEYDLFARTTDMFHVKQVQEIFTKLLNQGDIYLGKYEGDYCISCESFVTDSQKVNGCCPDCKGELKTIVEESYMFKCSKYSDIIKEKIEKDEIIIEPKSRKNEILNSFFDKTIPDLSISRTTFSWGIPIRENEKHVIYVWLDALTNYITNLKENNLEDYWPATIQLMGKEIVRFHAIYWPMILLALDLPLPKKLFAHGWLLMNGEKMSKSKKNVIYPEFLVENYSSDAVRYFLLREISFGQDGIFTPEAFVKRFNSDLVNEFSNLVNRTVAMVNKYFDGKVKNTGIIIEEAENLKKQYEKLNVSRETYIKNIEFSKDLEAIWEYIHYVNKYIDLTTPWILAKEEQEQEKLENVLYHLVDNILIIGNMIEPYMPNSGCKIKENIIKKDNEIIVPEKMEILFSRLDDNEKNIIEENMV